MTPKTRALIAVVVVGAALFGALALQYSDDETSLPEGARVLSDEREGPLRYRILAVDEEPFAAWVVSRGLWIDAEQMTWSAGEVEAVGAVYVQRRTLSPAPLRPDCALMVHRSPRGGLYEVYEGCGDEAAAAMDARRAELIVRPTEGAHVSDEGDDSDEAEEAPSTLPALWHQDIASASQCEAESPEAGRDIHDFDEAGRLVRIRNWRAPPAAEDREPWAWSITTWTYDAEGGYVRRWLDRPYEGPWERDDWEERATVQAAPRIEGAWTIHRWTYGADSEERRYRIEGGRLAASEMGGITRECTFDSEGRPLTASDNYGDGVEWQYTDGVLSSVERRVAGYEAVMPVVLEGEDVVVEEVHYRGDCAEVVFHDCSAVMQGLGHPLPAGLLPGAP